MTPLARFAHQDLADAAATRPPGYLAEVMALAVSTTETHVFLDRADYLALRRKYRGEEYPPATMVELWAELHVAPAPTQALIDSIAPRLPCGQCVVHWLAMLGRTPPDFTSLEAWRLWTWQRHNEVNALIDKPLVTYAEAAARWNW